MLRLPNSTCLYFDLNLAMSTFEICQVYPPIEKMDASLAQLQCCVKLSLSTNMIVNIQVFRLYKLSSRFFIDNFIFDNMIVNIQVFCL